MKIRPETPFDHKAVYELHKLAFGQDEESQLVDHIRNDKSYVPILSLVAEKDNKLVGHIMFSRARIKSERFYDTLALAPMAVLPEFQKQGIGSALVQVGLDIAEVSGFESVFVLGHKEFYPRFGFKKASAWNIACPFEVPDESFMAIELKPASLRDKAGVLVYAKPFNN
jgi:predicted N-acetyltransferase YhbS